METVEVYDRKGRSLGLMKRERTLSVSFVKLSTRQTRAKSLKQWKQGGIFSRKRNCVLTLAVQDPGQNSVATGSFNKCQSKQHTGVCNRPRRNETETWQKSNAVLNGYIPSFEEKSLPAIVALKLKRITFWAHLDTGSGRNFISKLLTD